MLENILLLILSLVTIAAMGIILRWYFRKLTRIEEEHWKGKTGSTTPRWALFLTGGKKGASEPRAGDKMIG